MYCSDIASNNCTNKQYLFLCQALNKKPPYGGYVIGERQTKLDADYPSSAPVCQFRCYLSLLAFHALTIPHNRHGESLSGHKPKITAPIRPNRTRQPSSRYPLFFSLPLAQAPRCCAPRKHKGEFKNWVKKTSRTPMG